MPPVTVVEENYVVFARSARMQAALKEELDRLRHKAVETAPDVIERIEKCLAEYSEASGSTRARGHAFSTSRPVHISSGASTTGTRSSGGVRRWPRMSAPASTIQPR